VEVDEAITSAAETAAASADHSDPAKDAPAKLTLAAEQNVADAARDTLRFGRDALERFRAGAADGDTEAIHQLRVTARRLRASMHLFSSVIHATWTKVIEQDLTWMAQAAGAAREREITAEVFRSRASKLEPALAEQLEMLYATLGSERAQKLAELGSVLESKRHKKMLARLDRPRVRKTPADASLASRAATLLRPIARSAIRAGADLSAASPPRAIHRLRVRVKRLRYAIEMQSALTGKRCRKLLRRLEELQDLLGALNDVTVANAWLINFPKSAGANPNAVMAAGAMTESLRRRSAKIARRCVKAWRKLEHSSAITDAVDEIRRRGKERLEQIPAAQPEVTETAA